MHIVNRTGRKKQERRTYANSYYYHQFGSFIFYRDNFSLSLPVAIVCVFHSVASTSSCVILLMNAMAKKMCYTHHRHHHHQVSSLSLSWRERAKNADQTRKSEQVRACVRACVRVWMSASMFFWKLIINWTLSNTFHFLPSPALLCPFNAKIPSLFSPSQFLSTSAQVCTDFVFIILFSIEAHIKNDNKEKKM